MHKEHSQPNLALRVWLFGVGVKRRVEIDAGIGKFFPDPAVSQGYRRNRAGSLAVIVRDVSTFLSTLVIVCCFVFRPMGFAAGSATSPPSWTYSLPSDCQF